MSFSLSPVIGASSSATERLWDVRDAHALGAPAGVALVGGRFTGTPNAGFGLSDDGAYDFRIGWRLTSAVPGDPGFSGEPRRPERVPEDAMTPRVQGATTSGSIPTSRAPTAALWRCGRTDPAARRRCG